MMAQTATPELRHWIAEQLRCGSSADALLAAMHSSGWERQVAEQALADTLGASSAHAARADLLPGDVAAAGAGLADPHVAGATSPADGLCEPSGLVVPEPDLSSGSHRLWAHDREVQLLLALRSPRLLLLGGLLSDEECDALVQAARPRMARSETVVNETGGNEVNPARTSSGMFFSRGETPLCARIESRIAALLRWPVSHGEGLQVLHYQPGAEYKPHHDFFDPTQPGMASVLARGGQRVGTLVIYLNTPAGGGATSFPEAGLEVAPVKGHAVFFSYAQAGASSRTLHGGAPVLAGEKWVATKWLRQGEFH